MLYHWSLQLSESLVSLYWVYLLHSLPSVLSSMCCSIISDLRCAPISVNKLA